MPRFHRRDHALAERSARGSPSIKINTAAHKRKLRRGLRCPGQTGRNPGRGRVAAAGVERPPSVGCERRLRERRQERSVVYFPGYTTEEGRDGARPLQYAAFSFSMSTRRVLTLHPCGASKVARPRLIQRVRPWSEIVFSRFFCSLQKTGSSGPPWHLPCSTKGGP